MPLTKIEEEIINPQLAQIGLQTSENTWQAINVVQGNGGSGVGDMSFGSCQIIDETTGERYVFREGEPYDPVSLPWAHLVGASFLCTNIGEVTLKVRAYIAIKDPDGVIRADAYLPALSRLPAIINPDVGYYSDYIGGVALDKLGLWLVYGRLEFDVA